MEPAGDGGAALHQGLEDAAAAEIVEDVAQVALELQRRVDLGVGRGVAEDDPQGVPAFGVADGEGGVVSARTVPAPTMTASLSARSRWASALASSPVIHWLLPSAAAVRPSRVAASLSTTHGRPVARCFR